mmetsp:Transcript_28832/g.33510  ORF Transcript_28832/g.33510 Transcript_28832/m.33510 type:complete len:313 (+) Transcript_28832:76-1014(+)
MSSTLAETEQGCSRRDQRLSKRGKIVLYGDSITQMSFSATLSGWGSYLADVYQRRCDVFNRGMSGYNTDWFIKYLETDEGHNDVFGMLRDDDKSANVKLVTIFFGANDASHPELNPRHHVPVARFASNLKVIVKKCQSNYGEDVNIILITPPPVHHDSRLKYQVQRYKEKATGNLERTLSLSGEYAKAVENVANELQLPCLNLWKEMQEDSDLEGKVETDKERFALYLSDGLHLSRDGNLFVGRRLVNVIAKHYPSIAVTSCPLTSYCGNSSSSGGSDLGGEGGIGPWHDEIDHTDVANAFKPKSSAKKIKT